MKIEDRIDRKTIVETIDRVEEWISKNGLKKMSRTKLTMTLEEILLSYMEKLGTATTFEIDMVRRNGDIRLKLTVPGEAFNPFSSESFVLEHFMGTYDAPPRWTHEDGVNVVRLTFQVYSTIFKNMRFSWEYMKGQRSRFFIAVVSQLIGVGLSVVAPVLSAKLIVAYTSTVSRQIVLIALAIFVVRLLTNLAGYLANRNYNKVYNITLSNLEDDLVDGALGITKTCLEEQGTGLFIQRLTVDTTRLATGINTLADMSSTVFNYAGILVAVAVISPHVFVLVLVLIVMQGIMERYRTIRLNVDDRIYREANERFTGFVGEMVRGSTDVKTLGSEKTFKEELSRRIWDANNKRMYMQDRSWTLRITRQELGACAYLGFIVLLGYLIAGDIITPVTAIVLFNYYTELDFTAINALGDFLEFVKDFNLSAERVYAILHGPEFPKERFGNVHMDTLKGDIRFDHVTFSYRSPDPHIIAKPVIKDMNLEITAGTTVALVGLSGSGKSTMLNLISKLHETSKGTVLIDGLDIRTLDHDTIRSNIAMVTQQPYIFNMSIRENLCIVRPDLTDEEMADVCKKACIYDEIMSMPKGFDTVIGEGGTNISGGQCQRIAIARALIRNSRILLLDEATSALDNITQIRIQKAIENLHGDRTVIVIAHRLSTIINADVIFFIEDGRILDSGTHKELMESCASYRSLYGCETV